MDDTSDNSKDATTWPSSRTRGSGSDTSVTSEQSRQNVSRKSTGSIQNMGQDNKGRRDEGSSGSSNGGGSVKVKAVETEGLKFMNNFDPQTSSRNQQKKKKRYHPNDGKLIQYADEYEDCDCMRPDCPGCHLPCKNCSDHRCGHECRVHRKWIYESVEIEGQNLEFRNPHFTTT